MEGLTRIWRGLVRQNGERLLEVVDRPNLDTRVSNSAGEVDLGPSGVLVGELRCLTIRPVSTYH